jgi:hypothetical protein
MWVVVSVLLGNWSTWCRKYGNQLPSYTASFLKKKNQLHRCKGLKTRTCRLPCKHEGQIQLLDDCILYSDHRHIY